MNEPLPPDDREARLARRLGDALEDGRLDDLPASLSGEEAGLVQALLDTREATAPRPPDAALTDRLWAAIAEETANAAPAEARPRAGVRPPRPQRLPARQQRWAWGLAAAFLVAVAVLWMVRLQAPGEVRVATAEATPTVYTAPDGSVVTLRPHSVLYALRGEPAETVRYRLEGEALFEIVSRPSRTVAVRGGGGTVAVLGTQFTMSTWGEALEVFLLEGRVRLTADATGEAVTLAPGERSGVASGGALLPPSPSEAALYLDWTEGVLRFEARPLERILAELGQHHGVTLSAAPPLRSETLSGRVLLDSLALSLDQLAVVAGGRFEQTAPDTYMLVR